MKKTTMENLETVLKSGKYKVGTTQIMNTYKNKAVAVSKDGHVNLFYDGIWLNPTLAVVVAYSNGLFDFYKDCPEQYAVVKDGYNFRVKTFRKLAADNFKRRNILEVERAEIFFKYNTFGMSTKEIALEHDCDQRTVQYIVSEYKNKYAKKLS